MEKKLFSSPKLSKCGTYISFQYWNDNKFCFERFKKHISRKIPPENYKKEVSRLLEYWSNELKNGYNPYKVRQQISEKIALNTLSFAVNKVCEDRTEFLRRKTRLTYTSKITCFLDWAKQKQFDNIFAENFSVSQANDFLRDLRKTRGVGETTRNGYLLLMRSLWNTMQKNGIVSENVWEKIDYVREERTGKLPFKAMQKKRIKDYVIEHDPELWLFIQFEYYCFIRPGELRHLTIGALDLDEGKIFIDAKISKNRKSEYVIIPPFFLKYLEEENIIYCNPNHYIFSKSGKPGSTQYGYNTMYERHKRILRMLGYDNGRYSLYSWKHTGACDAIRAGVKIKELQIQLRHADLQTTDIYLRSIGVDDLDDLREKFPTL